MRHLSAGAGRSGWSWATGAGLRTAARTSATATAARAANRPQARRQPCSPNWSDSQGTSSPVTKMPAPTPPAMQPITMPRFSGYQVASSDTMGAKQKAVPSPSSAIRPTTTG